MSGKDPLSYFDREDPLERDVYLKLREKVEEEADPGEIEQLPRFSFAMIKPGAYLRGLAPEVISRLRENGFKVMLMTVKKMSSKEIDDLYMFVKEKYQESWWIMPKVFNMAPVVPMVLAGDPQEHEHLSSRLRKLVGPTTPEVGSKGNIRYDLKGANRVLNIIHASDDPASALREALVFFSLSDVLSAIGGDEEQLLSEEELVPDDPIDISRWKILNEIKLEASDFLEAEREEILPILDEEAEVVSRDLPFDEEREALLEIESKISYKAEKLLQNVDREIVEKARSTTDFASKVALAERLEDREVALKIIELASDEVKLEKCREFDFLLMQAISRGIITNRLQEIVFHSTWAVMPQMLKDLNAAGKKVITSTALGDLS